MALAEHEPLDGYVVKIEFCIYMRRLAEKCAQKITRRPNGWLHPNPMPKGMIAATCRFRLWWIDGIDRIGILSVAWNPIQLPGAVSSASTLGISINGTTLGSYTEANVTGPINLNGASLSVVHNADTTAGSSFVIAQTTGGALPRIVITSFVWDESPSTQPDLSQENRNAWQRPTMPRIPDTLTIKPCSARISIHPF